MSFSCLDTDQMARLGFWSPLLHLAKIFRRRLMRVRKIILNSVFTLKLKKLLIIQNEERTFIKE